MLLFGPTGNNQRMHIFCFKEIGKLRTRGTTERAILAWCHSEIRIS